MPEWGVDNREIWADEQLTRTELPDRVVDPVRRLLVTWRMIPHDERDVIEILKIFSELAQDHALEGPTPKNTRWEPVRPGFIRVGDTVRVKPDAFRGEIGQIHNGRLCRVVAIRSGDIIVNSMDDGPQLFGVHYSPFSLDKRVVTR
jgi:hypothetical protein